MTSKEFVLELEKHIWARNLDTIKHFQQLKKDLKRFNELYDKVKCKLDNAQKDLEIEKNKIDKEVIIYNSSMIKLEQLKGQIIAYNDILTIMEKEMLDE